MEKFLCKVCGYIYSPEENKNVDFINLEENWKCPICHANKDEFEKIQKV